MTLAEEIFSDQLARRLAASAAVGKEAYGTSPEKWERGDNALREQMLARGYASISHMLGPLAIAAATDPNLNSYGAWNPTILFVGLTGGTQRTAIARAHEHVIGYPQLLLRMPLPEGTMAKGNPWFPAELMELTQTAIRELALSENTDVELQRFALEKPADFARASASSLLMLNLSSQQVGVGGKRHVPIDLGRHHLERHIRVFRPQVIVSVQDEVARQLAATYPASDIGPKVPGDLTVRVASVIVDEQRLPVVLMPIHPNAKGTNMLPYRESKPRIAAAIAAALATRAV